MKARYEVLPIEGSEGIELLGEPFPKRIYGPGDIIELDDAKHDIEGLRGRGQIRLVVEPTSLIKDGDEKEEITG